MSTGSVSLPQDPMPTLDEPDLCPPWWPKLIWDLHLPYLPHFPRPGPGPGGPVNYPAGVDDMMASLAIHTLSYILQNRDAGRELRKIAERNLVAVGGHLDEMHEKVAAGSL